MRFNHAKKNTIESELIRLTSLILLSSIILCTIISNLILYKQNYENVKRYNNDMLEQISQSTSSYFSTINLVVYNFVCNQQAQYYLIQARKDNSPTTSTISSRSRCASTRNSSSDSERSTRISPTSPSRLSE